MMSKDIHAHKVLALISQQPMTEPDLRAAVQREFGADARFRTCHRNGFDLDSLLIFLREKQKVHISDEVWHINPAHVCQH